MTEVRTSPSSISVMTVAQPLSVVPGYSSDETRRTLPKTNERDRRNQSLPNNVTGRHLGTFTRRSYLEQ